MGSFSIWHWLIVLLVVLLLFGSGKISGLMGDLATGIKSFKKNMREDEPDASLAESAPPAAAKPAGSIGGGVDPVTVALLLGVGLTGTVGQVFLTKAYAAGPPSRVAVLSLTQVAFGQGLDALVWRRPLPAASLAGTVLVLAPTAWLLARAGTSAGAEGVATS